MSSILAAIKQDNQEAAEWLLFYYERRKQYYAAKKDIINATHVPDNVGHGSGPGNPTMQKTMQLTALIHTEKWLSTIETVEDMLSDKKAIFLQVRREAACIPERNVGRPAWVVYVQHHYADAMAEYYRGRPEQYWLGETTVRSWWQRIIDLTARVAIKKGCL